MSLQQVLLAAATRRNGGCRPTGCALPQQQSFQHIDGGIEGRANGAVFRLAIPAAVLQLFAQQAGDDCLDVLTKVSAEADGPAVDAGLDLTIEESLAGVLPMAGVSDLRHNG